MKIFTPNNLKTNDLMYTASPLFDLWFPLVFPGYYDVLNNSFYDRAIQQVITKMLKNEEI